MRDQDSDLWKGFMFAFLLFLLSSLQSLFNHQYMYSCFTVGMRVKTAVMGLVYRKSLVISSAARQSCTVGEIVNLVSADTQKLMDMVVYFNAVWVAPIEIALCLFFLWQVGRTHTSTTYAHAGALTHCCYPSPVSNSVWVRQP
uniref:ABC transmembrane type-1 domain-containing protein n=1 Tax=Hucho hucho TaxID=62062 RepID=A0A4W5JQ63_9TELE